MSAYLHAAAMVKAGVYLVARFAPGVLDGPRRGVWIVVVLGCGTMLLGGYRALRQHDLKLILAFGTVSQLGLIVLLVGLGHAGDRARGPGDARRARDVQGGAVPRRRRGRRRDRHA